MERAYQLFGGTWVETYMNTPNKNYAGVGFVYHWDKQNFEPVKPYPSWVLDSLLHWQSPVSKPDTINPWIWDESKKNWKSYFDK